MSKGIIVVDKMSVNCRNIRGDKNGCPFGGMVCQINKEDVMEHVKNGTKPNWCPIKPMPERKALTGDLSNVTKMGEELVKVGWNECLEKIEDGG